MASQGTRETREPVISAEDTLAIRATNAEFSERIAALQAAFEAFRADTEKRLAARAAEPVTLVPLKSACSAENYERGRRMCARGLVPSRKFGGRWMVDADDLQAKLAARISGAALGVQP